MGEFGYPFKGAYYYDPRTWRDPLWIVIHSTGVHEHPDYAEDLGNFFSRPRSDGQQVSSHFGCDSNSTVQYVMTRNVAYCARQVGNEHGIHIELSGNTQTRSQWLDAFGQGLLNQAAKLCQKLMGANNIPLKALTDAELRGRKLKGFTTHAQITRVFGGTHTDPGTAFPMDELFTRIAALTKPPVKETKKMLSDETITVPAVPINLPTPSGVTTPKADVVLGYLLARTATCQGEIANLHDAINGANSKLDQVIALLTEEN